MSAALTLSSATPPRQSPGSASQFTVCKTSERARPAFQLGGDSDSSNSFSSQGSSNSDDENATATGGASPTPHDETAAKSLQAALDCALNLSDDSNNRADDSQSSGACDSPPLPQVPFSTHAATTTRPAFSLAAEDSSDSASEPPSPLPPLKPMLPAGRLAHAVVPSHRVAGGRAPARDASDPCFSAVVTQAKLDAFFRAKTPGPPPGASSSGASEGVGSRAAPGSKSSRLAYDPATSSLVTQQKLNAFFEPRKPSPPLLHRGFTADLPPDEQVDSVRQPRALELIAARQHPTLESSGTEGLSAEATAAAAGAAEAVETAEAAPRRRPPLDASYAREEVLEVSTDSDEEARGGRTKRLPQSPYTGVSWHRPTGQWQANLKVANFGTLATKRLLFLP